MPSGTARRRACCATFAARDAQAVISRIPDALASYPYPTEYRVWPGPNSNTFIAHMGRAIPELRLSMPSTAIGKDYVSLREIVGPSPSHTGIAVSLYGLAGVMAAWDEGIEVNVLGLVAGVDLRHPALKVPGIGRVPGLIASFPRACRFRADDGA